MIGAIVRIPTGFADRPPVAKQAWIHGFVYGSHPDANGYDRRGECVQAVCQISDLGQPGGLWRTVPISWLGLEPLVTQDGTRIEREEE